LAAPLALAQPACDDTAVVLVVQSDRVVPAELDAFCLEVDAASKPQFHVHKDATTFPQTLTVLPGGDDSFAATVFGLRQGVYVDDVTLRIGFRNHEVRDIDLPLRRCPPLANSGKYRQVDAAVLAGSVPALVGTAAGPRVIAFVPGGAQELGWNGSTLAPVGARLATPPAGIVTALVAADLDGNCTIDLVIGEAGGPAHVWTHDGVGGFTEVAGALPADLVGPKSLAVADFDGDGKVDLVAVGPSARMFRGDGSGHFNEVANAFVPAPSNATAAAAADLDGAGGPDLVVGQTGGAGTLVYLNDSGVLRSSPGALPPITLDIVGIAAVDVDGDGDRDVVLAHAGGVKLLLNRGNGFLEDGSFGRVPGGTMAAGLAAADLDRDCQVDLVIPTVNGTPLLWAGQGGGMLAAAMVDGAAGTQSHVAVGDVDGNGSRDVVLSGASGGAVWVQQ
jgi:hypothetical protein